MKQGRKSAGFTLIELLIVIAIIGTLAALITSGISKVRQKAAEAQASNDINTSLVVGIKTFLSDMGFYPAFDKVCEDDEVEDFNAFPELYENLCGEKPSDGGRGGKNSPYAELKAESICVEDDSEITGYAVASTDELYNPDIEKFYIDPWGQPYVYRENDSKKREDWMVKPNSFDLWSVGPDGKNDACYGRDEIQKESCDDIGNW